MSAEDAVPNSERAERLRKLAALQRAVSNYGDVVTTMTGTADGYEGEITATLDVDLLLAAANALDAQGVPGYTAARLIAGTHWGDEAYGDTILENADTAADVISEYRRHHGSKYLNQISDDLTRED